MQTDKIDLVVLGGGPAGIEAAVRGAERGLRTVLISNSKPGGRATFGSLVPSKVWLNFAEKAHLLRQAKHLGFPTGETEIDIEILNNNIREQSRTTSLAYAARLETAGVHLLQGQGMLLASGRVQYVQEGEATVPVELQTRFVLIASGSEPAFRPGFQPNGQRIIAPRLAGSLSAMPETVLVAGGGVTGVEYAWAFASLGARVTLVHRGAQLLRDMDPELSTAIEHWLQQHLGVHIEKGNPVTQIEQRGEKVLTTTQNGGTYTTDLAFIAAGRRADLRFFDAHQLHLPLTEGFLAVDAFCRTSLPGVYAAGDVTGNPMTANRAVMQARVAVDHMAGGAGSPRQQHPTIEAVYTHPAIAQIGDLSQANGDRLVRIPFDQLLKARLAGETEGFLKIRTDQTGRILAAGAFGTHAYDILAPLQVGIHQGLLLRELAAVPFAHPGWNEAVSS